MNKNPYEVLSKQYFWRTGVVDNIRSNKNFSNIWESKFLIDKNTRFITVGSCFAQHISRWILNNGYNWVESEKAPDIMNSDEMLDNGYGVFSFRTGNIYTASLLKQWIYFSINYNNNYEIFEERNRFYDPLRPLIPKNGYKSIDDMLNDRILTFNAINSSLLETDIFIFTLGLTEAWVNKRTGLVYSSCPGTLRGSFNEDEHEFINYDYNSIINDMNSVFNSIKKINNNIKFLLTVSPVPLTATASSEHILLSTIYSKSILRSVAGRLSHIRDDVDYFPSYELISSFPIGNKYYAENMRTVKNDGVEFVMNHFEMGISKNNNIKPSIIKEDVVCEETLLETWQDNTNHKENFICLIGDSHMGKLSESFLKNNINHSGGMIMNGSAWENNRISLDNEEFFVPLEDSGSRKRWLDTLIFFKNDKDKVIISNICMQTHVSITNLINYCNLNGIKELNEKLFDEYFKNKNFDKIKLIESFLLSGSRVIIITDPPTKEISPLKNFINLFDFYDNFVCNYFISIGCEVFNSKKHYELNGFNDSYFSNKIMEDGKRDWIHGSQLYYDDITKILLKDYI